MGVKFVLSVASLFLLVACVAEARNVAYRIHRDGQGSGIAVSSGRRVHSDVERSVSPKQARVFPGAVAIKKLVLLKFKKIIPISLILLKSSDDNEAELVPVYPTSEIPANVQFIPTPNGISGHKDVQAIAIPTELHQQLELNGLANLENIEALLNSAVEEKDEEDMQTLVQAVNKDDELLNVKEDDEDQLLTNVASLEKPTKIATVANVPGLRRVTAEEIIKPGLKSPHQTSVEEIPLFLYSAKDGPQNIHTGRKQVRQSTFSGRRQHA